ncbi:chemotaxis protein CheD [uncultured Sphingomonas sp.]|uniref:chemotaxis protein CheD n=1 Tax=uncultured Sphingomonas sp. TaxID=158754 RepID=UPI0035CADF72
MRRIAIIQGDHIATREPNTVITTLLGSCIAVCLHDAVAHVGGMNHFLLGQPEAGAKLGSYDMQRYGVHAMELLINAMMAQGAARDRLRAHIYGGATIVAGLGGIGSENAAFAKRFIETEGIAIGHVDVGGSRARKVEFLPHDGKARAQLVAQAVPLITTPTPLPVHADGELELF